jgi:hypothetical protein
LVPITNGVADAPQPVAGTGQLRSVACPTATFCIALARGGVVVPITDGVPGPIQVVEGVETLWDAACPSATICYAVGYTFPDPNDPFRQTAVLVPITNGVVACPTTTTCQAVDVYSPIPGNLGVAVTITKPPSPTEVEKCKNGGWRSFTNPPFKNQGECVRSVTSDRK